MLLTLLVGGLLLHYVRCSLSNVLSRRIVPYKEFKWLIVCHVYNDGTSELVVDKVWTGSSKKKRTGNYVSRLPAARPEHMINPVHPFQTIVCQNDLFWTFDFYRSNRSLSPGACWTCLWHSSSPTEHLGSGLHYLKRCIRISTFLGQSHMRYFPDLSFFRSSLPSSWSQSSP